MTGRTRYRFFISHAMCMTHTKYISVTNVKDLTTVQTNAPRAKLVEDVGVITALRTVKKKTINA